LQNFKKDAARGSVEIPVRMALREKELTLAVKARQST